MDLTKIEAFYNKNYKTLMFIPVIVLIIALILIGIQYSRTGDFINKDVSLKGGISATVYTDKDIKIDDIKNDLNDASVRKLADLSSGKQLGVLIEVSGMKSDELKSYLENKLDIKLTEENYSVEETGASLGESFYKELLIAIAFAFLLMGIVVLIVFRTFIPSIAVIFAAFTDIIIPVAIINLMGMKVSTAGIVAFLMVIGYSIDTDILLTTRSIKRTEGILFERMFSAMKTGLTMTFTTISALLVAVIVTTSTVIREMFIIILIALVTDIFSTYLTNAGILKWYCDKKGIK